MSGFSWDEYRTGSDGVTEVVRMPGINVRFWDDSIFAVPGSPRPAPRFVSSLVNRLGLAQATMIEKDRGINAWLRNHSPCDSLRRSLARGGYDHLLRDDT